jgi:hypothetical protein
MPPPMRYEAALTKNTDPLLLASNLNVIAGVHYHSKKGILAEVVLRLPCYWQDKMSLRTISAVPLILIEVRRNQYILFLQAIDCRTHQQDTIRLIVRTMDNCLLEHAS